MYKTNWINHFDKLAVAAHINHTYKLNGFKSKLLARTFRQCVQALIVKYYIPSNIIDLGCGDGSVTAQFSSITKVFGCDGSTNMLKLASSKGLIPISLDFDDLSTLTRLPIIDGTCVVICESLVCSSNPYLLLVSLSHIIRQSKVSVVLSIPNPHNLLRKAFNFFENSKFNYITESAVKVALSPITNSVETYYILPGVILPTHQSTLLKTIYRLISFNFVLRLSND